MAEGGDVTFEMPWHDPYDDPYDDDRDDEMTPLILQTSTPHSRGGEEIVMQTMQHESLGLPEKSQAETSFGGSKTSEMAWVTAKNLFPDMSSSELEVSYNTKGKLQVKMFGSGKKLYSLITTERGTNREVINKSLPKEIKTALGPSKYERVQKITSDKRKELKESQDLAAQREQNKKEMDEKTEDLKKAKKDLEDLENAEASAREIERAQAKVRTLEAEKVKAHSKFLKSVDAEKKTSIEDDISVLEELQKENEADVERAGAREALAAIQTRKEALGWRKEQEIRKLAYETDLEKRRLAKEKLFELNKSYQEIVSDENTFKTILGEKLTLTEEKKEQLKKDKEILVKHNEKDKEVINDRDAWPNEKLRAQERVDFRNQEIRQIDAQLEEGGESLSEKVKAIFKKYGLTLTAIFLAAGVTIGAVIGVITNALKAMGKQIANGLKTLGQKAAAALPGLIGSIVSFLFKTAGQVFGFLAEHTWLLILAVVVFLFQNYIKKAALTRCQDKSDDCYSPNNHSRFVCFVAVGFFCFLADLVFAVFVFADLVCWQIKAHFLRRFRVLGSHYSFVNRV